MNTKTYIIDTSVIIDNPVKNILKLSDNNSNTLIIPDIVLKELDKHKTGDFNVGIPARTFFKMLKGSVFNEVKSINNSRLCKDDKAYSVALKIGDNDIDIIILVRNSFNANTLSSYSVNDSKIIEIASDYNFTCITNDISFQVVAKSIGVSAESLIWNSLENPEDVTFFKSIKSSELDTSVPLFRKWDQIEIVDINESGYETGKRKYALMNGGNLINLNMEEDAFSKYPITPINLEQKFYTHLLSSYFQVALVTGATGSGKTLLALQEGMRRVKDKNSNINGIVYMRYTVNIEDKFSALGYRKGDEQTKLGYFNYPLYGALNFIVEKRNSKNEKSSVPNSELVEEMISDYGIEFLDIAHARGTTITNKFIIFDEIQNTPDQVVKTIGTRVGEGSVIVFMGDYNQVDHPYLTKERNGLITLLGLTKKDSMIAAIQLKHTVRSDIAEWFQNSI